MADEYYKTWVLKGFLERLTQRFGSVPLKAFQLLHVDTYVHWRQKSGVKNASINREISALSHMFTWAAKRGISKQIQSPVWKNFRNRSGPDRNRLTRSLRLSFKSSIRGLSCSNLPKANQFEATPGCSCTVHSKASQEKERR